MAGDYLDTRSVLIAHSDATVRAHLKTLLRGEFATFVETDDIIETLTDENTAAHTLVLLGSSFLTNYCSELCSALRLRCNSPVLVLLDSDDQLSAAVEAGADDILSLSAVDAFLVQRVRFIVQREARPHMLLTSEELAAELEEELRFAWIVSETVGSLTRLLKPDDILALLVENATVAVNHDRANIVMFTATEVRVVHHSRGYTPEQSAVMKDFTLPIHLPYFEQAMLSGAPILVQDTLTNPKWFPVKGFEWVRSHVGVPIRAHDVVIGFLNLDSEHPHAFNEKHAERLRIFADQAAIAIENAQLYEEMEREANENSALHRATAFLLQPNLFTSDNLLEVAEQIALTAVVEFGKVDCGIILVDQDTSQLTRLARAGGFNVNVQQTLHMNGLGLVPQAIRTKQSVYAPDVSTESNYAANNLMTRSELVIPLRATKGVIGVLDLQSAEINAFSADDRRILEVFAERVAVVIENILLYNRIRDHADEMEMRVQQRTLELHRALEHERELSVLKSRFIARVSHEFRTPLAVMTTASELLNHYGERMTVEQRTEKLARIQGEVQNLILMLDDILTIGTGTTETKSAFKPDKIDLKHLAADIIHAFEEGAGSQHEFQFNFVGRSLVYLDPIWARRILQNLLSNAVKYSPPGSSIRLNINRTDVTTTISVQDRGIGIPDVDQPRLFDAFHRAHNVEDVNGTGLGLAIVRQAVELHNGEITYFTKLGVGTTFVVTLPENTSGKNYEEDISGRGRSVPS